MKTKFFLAAVIGLVGTVAFAGTPGNPQVEVINQKNANVFKVIYKGETIGKVQITVLDKNGSIVFAETTRKVSGFIQRLDFTGMEYGEYTLEVSDQSGKLTRTLVYANETTVKNIRVSKMTEEGKYLLAVNNNGAEQINVRIFDGASNLVHSEDMTINGNLRLVYNLKDVAGVPIFEVTDKTGNVRTIKY